MKDVQLANSVYEKLKELPNEDQANLVQTLEDVSVNQSIATPLKANLQGIWQYMTKKYRILFEIKDNTINVLVLEERPTEEIRRK